MVGGDVDDVLWAVGGAHVGLHGEGLDAVIFFEPLAQVLSLLG